MHAQRYHKIISTDCPLQLYTDWRFLLQNYLWPLIKENALVHDSYTCAMFPGSMPFPTQRVNHTFVGMSSDEKQLQLEPCPTVCRPSDHQDWEYCWFCHLQQDSTNWMNEAFGVDMMDYSLISIIRPNQSDLEKTREISLTWGRN